MIVLQFFDPINWVFVLVTSLFKLLVLGISIFVCLNTLIYVKYSVLGRPIPEPDLEEQLEEKERKKKEKTPSTPEELENVESTKNGKIYGRKLGANFNTTLMLVALDYILSWFYLFSNGDGLLFGWTNHWCIFLSPLLQVLWSYNAGSLLIWFSWVVMVHFVFAAAVHLFFHSIEWSASTKDFLEWVVGLLFGLYNCVFQASAAQSKEVLEHATNLSIESNLLLAVTDEVTVTKAYKKAALKWHPDRARVWAAKHITPAQAQEKFRECKKSRDVLIDTYVRTRSRAISFLTKTTPMVLVVTVLDKCFIGFIWGGDSWWPLAWPFWTFVAHSLIVFTLWWTIPFATGIVVDGGWWFVSVSVVVCACSVGDGVLGYGYLWRRYDDGASSAWFLYWELLWVSGAILTHFMSFVLLMFVAPGDEWDHNQKMQADHAKDKALHPSKTEEEEEKRDSAQTFALFYALLLHPHTLMKMACIVAVSVLDYFWLHIGLYWNAYNYSWPWNFMFGMVFLLFALLRVSFLILVLLHFAGTTGPIRKASAMAVLPVLLMVVGVVFYSANGLNGGGSGVGNNGYVGNHAGLGNLNVEQVTQSIFDKARVKFDEMMDQEEKEEQANKEKVLRFQSGSGSGRGGALFGGGDDGGGQGALQAGAFGAKDGAKDGATGKAGAGQEEDDVGKNDLKKPALTTKVNEQFDARRPVCSWSSWLVSHFVRMFVPACYVIFALRRKKIQSTDGDVLGVLRQTIVRWTTVSAGLSLWFGTIDSCFHNSSQVEFALPFLLLGVSRTSPQYFPWSAVQHTGVKWLLVGLCGLYFPYSNWMDPGMIRMYLCLTIPCVVVLVGIGVQRWANTEWVNSWFSREEYWGKFREIVAGDTGSDDFQTWFDNLLNENKNEE